jgi:glyoxylase-like metal-dependent hydrolase (beta-lactamase superfamily II)
VNETNKLENAIQPKGWYSSLPRAIYATLERVPVKNAWFEVYKLPHDVYAIYEPGQFQEVMSFLILGSDKAVLVDTGMGMGNIKSVTDELTDMEVEVINTHTHFDHLGDNHRFSKISVFDDEEAIATMKNGADHAHMVKNIIGDSVWKPWPEGFDPEHYVVPGSVPTQLLHDGDVIDLGDRTLEVIHSPGHSPESICLLDQKNGILFTGDVYYPAPMYVHLPNSNLDDYVVTMERLASIPDLKYVYPAHNEPIVKPEVLGKAAAALKSVQKGGHPYNVDSNGLRKYLFPDNISVITKDK